MTPIGIAAQLARFGFAVAALGVFLAAVACGATFYEELTTPGSTEGLFWLHFSRTVPSFWRAV